MGAGKSTVGRRLATKLQRPFFDLDHYIEKQTACQITDIFTHQGEEQFRQLESESLRQLLHRHDEPLVLATGGGAILREQNRKLMRAQGIVIFLAASWETIYQRLANNNSRPLINPHHNHNPTAADEKKKREKIKDLLTSRKPFYNFHDLKIVTDHKDIETIVQEIITKLVPT